MDFNMDRIPATAQELITTLQLISARIDAVPIVAIAVCAIVCAALIRAALQNSQFIKDLLSRSGMK